MADSFKQLGVSPDIRKGLAELNIKEPTDIQAQVIPVLLQEKIDLIGQAQTGTGKTAAFGVPLLERISSTEEGIQALVLAPTRELCQQIAKQLFKFTKYTEKIFTEAVFGGAKIDVQIDRLKRPTHILVATPGRLVDLLQRKVVKLDTVKTVVLDEADEMLSMGFKKQLDIILERLPEQRNTWLFSATMPPGIKAIIKNYMDPNAAFIRSKGKGSAHTDIRQEHVLCDESEKLNILIHFLKVHKGERGIVFCNTKNATNTLAKQLQARNYPVGLLEGDMKQKERDKMIRAFKNENIEILVATDVVARGIDIHNLAFVVHYEIPMQTEYFIHRSGRTGRGGNKGLSMAFVSAKEKRKYLEIEKETGIKSKKVPYA